MSESICECAFQLYNIAQRHEATLVKLRVDNTNTKLNYGYNEFSLKHFNEHRGIISIFGDYSDRTKAQNLQYEKFNAEMKEYKNRILENEYNILLVIQKIQIIKILLMNVINKNERYNQSITPQEKEIFIMYSLTQVK